MRSHNELHRLAAAGPAVLAHAGWHVDAGEEDGILERILSSPREAASPRSRLGARRAAVLAGVAVVAAAAAVASIDLAQSGGPAATGGPRLTGATLSLAGYRFRTPAGFQSSSTRCGASATDRFSAAASADGGCVSAFFMISFSRSPLVPVGAEAVGVGAYQGHLVSQGDPQMLTLYVDLPATGDVLAQDVVLNAQGLTAEQLVAVAESGLPATPSATVG